MPGSRAPRRTEIVALAALLGLLACDGREPRAASHHPSEPVDPTDAFTALTQLGAPAEPLLYDVELDRWIDSEVADGLLPRLEAAIASDPSGLPWRSRVILQNDVWGLWQRLEELEVSSARRRALVDACARLIAHLAPERREPTDRVEVLDEHFDRGDGWRDATVEVPRLSHESLFGLRRHFYVRRRGEGERVLFSRLVALDPRGEPFVTDVVGDVEALRFEGDTLREAQLFELDRALAAPGPVMRPTDAAEQVPSRGANGFLARFAPPEPLTDLPCVRCHDDAHLGTLANPELEDFGRYDSLLRRVERPGRPR